jgi:hypothetical protein
VAVLEQRPYPDWVNTELGIGGLQGTASEFSVSEDMWQKPFSEHSCRLYVLGSQKKESCNRGWHETGKLSLDL